MNYFHSFINSIKMFSIKYTYPDLQNVVSSGELLNTCRNCERRRWYMNCGYRLKFSDRRKLFGSSLAYSPNFWHCEQKGDTENIYTQTYTKTISPGTHYRHGIERDPSAFFQGIRPGPDAHWRQLLRRSSSRGLIRNTLQPWCSQDITLKQSSTCMGIPLFLYLCFCD